MDWSGAGLVGAFVGLVIGVIDLWFVARFVEASLRRSSAPEGREAQDDFERRIKLMRLALAVGTIGLFPIVGYWLGRTIFG